MVLVMTHCSGCLNLGFPVQNFLKQRKIKSVTVVRRCNCLRQVWRSKTFSSPSLFQREVGRDFILSSPHPCALRIYSEDAHLPEGERTFLIFINPALKRVTPPHKF